MRISKKILACVLAALMAISMMPFTAFAATTEVATAEALAAAITAANAGDTITLTADVEVSSPVVIPAGKDVKLDINNHSLSGNIADTDGKKLIQVSGKLEFVGNGGCIYNTNVSGQGHAACQALSGGTVIVNAPVTFGDSDTDRTNANAVNRGCGIQNNGGTLILNDGYYTAIDANYSTGAWAYAILNCEGDTTINKATVYGLGLHGALGCEEGTLTVNDGTFAVNGANNYYSLYCDGGSIIVNGGSFTDNSKYGVNYIGKDSDTEINGGDFTFSSTTPFVQSSSKGDLVVSGGSFEKDGAAFTVPAKYLAEGCTQDSETGVVSQTSVAKIGSTYYATLEEAAEAATAGQTITLIADIDFTSKYAKGALHLINLEDKTLDLNGHLIKTQNQGVAYYGDNATIKNGRFSAVDAQKGDGRGSYGIFVYPEDYYSSGNTDIVYDSSENVVLDNINVAGGINCFGASVTIKNSSAAGTHYYGVWADVGARITVESGTYSSDALIANGVIACNANDATSSLTVTGGTFTVKNGKNLVLTGKRDVIISGGFYHYADGSVYTVKAENIANGYIQDMSTGEVIANKDVDTMSITVEDNIDLNIYVADPSNEIKTIDFSYNVTPDAEAQNIETVTVPARKNADGKIPLKVELAPAQIMDNIKVVAKNANGDNVKEFETSVSDYCKTIIENTGFTTEMKNLAKSTLDYGKAASTYFGYNSDAAWVSSDLADPSAQIQALATAAERGYFNSNVMHVTSVSYRATSTPEIRFYLSEDLRVQSYLSGLNLKCNIGKVEFAKTAEGTAMLRIYDIDIVDFNKQIVVKYSVNEFEEPETELLKFTPITWVNSAIKSSDEKLSGLGKGIGKYYLASAAYFGE